MVVYLRSTMLLFLGPSSLLNPFPYRDVTDILCQIQLIVTRACFQLNSFHLSNYEHIHTKGRDNEKKYT